MNISAIKERIECIAKELLAMYEVDGLPFDALHDINSELFKLFLLISQNTEKEQ